MSHLVDMFGHPIRKVTYGRSRLTELLRAAEQYYYEQAVRRHVEDMEKLEVFFPTPLYDCDDKPIDTYKPIKYDPGGKYFKWPVDPK